MGTLRFELDWEQKVEIVNKITEFHPGSQVGRKWEVSTYVGGMVDTGSWYELKMITKFSLEQLEQILREVEIEFNTKIIELSEEDKQKQKNIIYLPGEGRRDGGVVTNQYESESRNEIFSKLEMELLWGKSI